MEDKNKKTSTSRIDVFKLNRKSICVIGLKETLVMYYINHEVIEQTGLNPEYERDDNYWCRLSLKDFSRDLPFMGATTIRKILKELKEKDLIIVRNYNESKGDRTLWYTINFHKLSSILNKTSA